MSKLIITGVDANGKITYVEGEEVVTSVSDIESRVLELREKISAAKAVDLSSLEQEHELAKAKILEEYRSSICELEKAKDEAMAEEDKRFELAKSRIVPTDELEVLEREEAKLSLVLGGLKAQSKEAIVENQPEVESPSEAIEEEIEAYTEEPAQEVKEKVYGEVSAENVTAPVENTPRRIIF